MKFGQLIFRKINKLVATSCQILKLKCPKIDWGWARPRAPPPEGGESLQRNISEISNDYSMLCPTLVGSVLSTLRTRSETFAKNEMRSD